MSTIREIRSRTTVLPNENVDTDQIIPARYLITTSSEGLGEGLFADWRYDATGEPKPDFVLNHESARGAKVLVVGRNFGCGSSREHAVWALQGGGFQAVVATAFADIFRANALKNGLVPVVVDEATHRLLVDSPGAEVRIDIDARTLTLGNHQVSFPLESFSRYCLLNGLDELAFLVDRQKDIAAFEEMSGPAPWSL